VGVFLLSIEMMFFEEKKATRAAGEPQAVVPAPAPPPAPAP
jgi:hypothetical protein